MFRRKPKPIPEPSIRAIALTTIRHRSSRGYGHQHGTLEAMTAAAEAVQHLGVEAIIDALEAELRAREYVKNLDDPCDAWVA